MARPARRSSLSTLAELLARALAALCGGGLVWIAINAIAAGLREGLPHVFGLGIVLVLLAVGLLAQGFRR